MYSLLEADGTETGVEGTKTLSRRHLAETAHQTTSVCRLGHKTNARRLERAQRYVGKEFGGGGGGEVDGGAVLRRSFVAEEGDGLLLEELVAAELEGTLQEVTGEGRASACEEGASAFFLHDLAEATNHAAVVGSRVKLDASLDAV